MNRRSARVGRIGCLAACLWASAGLGTRQPVVAWDPAPPGDPVELVLDDGTREDRYGILENFFIFNQFTPTEYPLEIDEVQVLFPPDKEGGSYDILLYEDADGDPATGATLRLWLEDLPVTEPDRFLVVPIDPPVRFSGPGDILLAAAYFSGGGLGQPSTTRTPKVAPGSVSSHRHPISPVPVSRFPSTIGTG